MTARHGITFLGMFSDWIYSLQELRLAYQSRFRLAVQGGLVALLLNATQLYAAPLSNAARGEIDSLLSRLGTSGCQFKRNGSWHTAAEAQAHLRRKLDYLIDRDAVANAEQFIERAATKSSKSGKAYQMQCGRGASVASGEWLRIQLHAIRDGEKSGPN